MEVSILCLLSTFVNLGEGGQNVNRIGDVNSEGELVELLLSHYEKSSRPVLDVSGNQYDDTIYRLSIDKQIGAYLTFYIWHIGIFM